MKKTLAAIGAAAALAGAAVVATKPPPLPCVMAPRKGADCLRKAPHWKGEARWFGVENVFPRAEAVGSECVSVECVKP